MNIKSESNSVFKVKFYGANNINATTLATSLNNIVGSVKDITKDLYPDADATLNVVSTKTGCFEIHLDTIIKYLPTIFDKDNIQIATNVIFTFLNILIVKKHLLGKPPKEIVSKDNSTQIKNQNDQSLSVPRNIAKIYFNSPVIDNRTINIFNSLKSDNNRDDLLIESSDGTTKIEFKKSEYDNMSVKIVEGIQSTQDVFTQVVEVSLLLKKPDLLGKSKWGFIYNKIIEAEIKDHEWLEQVQKGFIKNLYAGVKIPVKLLVEVDLDEFKNPKGEPKYSILEVTGEIIEPTEKQKSFEF